MSIDVRRGTARFLTLDTGRSTRHSFSFGGHYDPDNLHLGPLVCHDDHELEPGAGFPDHRHADVEIVTWVVAGELVHDRTSVVRPGRVAVQSAGSGIVHSEVAGAVATRFVQAWLRSEEPGGTPRREVADTSPAPGRLTALVGPGAPLAIGVAGASLGVLRLDAGTPVATLPATPLGHVFVVTGQVVVAGEPLVGGDALRLTEEGPLEVRADVPAELLVWTFA